MKQARAYVRRVKRRSCCKFCKTTKDLTFHHVRGTKRMDVSTAASKGRSLYWLKREIAKCIVLCRWCHERIEKIILTAKRSESEAA